MVAIARSNTADWAEGSPNLQHPHSDRTMGRGAAAHSKYMANEYKAIKLEAPQAAKAKNISAYARVMKCDWWPLIVVLQFLKILKVKQLTLQHNSKSFNLVKEKSQHTCCIL